MNLESLSVEELEAFRDDLQLQIENLRAQFVDAGKILEIKRGLQGVDIDEAIKAAEREVARLRGLQTNTEVVKVGSK